MREIRANNIPLILNLLNIHFNGLLPLTDFEFTPPRPILKLHITPLLQFKHLLLRIDLRITIRIGQFIRINQIMLMSKFLPTILSQIHKLIFHCYIRSANADFDITFHLFDFEGPLIEGLLSVVYLAVSEAADCGGFVW